LLFREQHGNTTDADYRVMGRETVERSRRVVRRQTLDWALTTIGRGVSVLLLGEDGIGKTFLKNAVGESLPRPEFTVVRVTATFGRSQLAWAALGSALDLPDLHTWDDRQVDTLLTDRLAELSGGTNSTVVLLVEDALLLDRDSIEWIGAAARKSLVVVLAAMDRTSTGPDAVHSASESVLRGLWIDGIAERCDLHRLDESSSLRLAEAFGAGALDSATQRYIVQQGAGIPLLIRELVLDQLERRAAELSVSTASAHGHAPGQHAQHALAAAPFTTSGPRAYDLSRMRVSGLSPHQRECVALLAQLGTIPQQRAAHLAGAATLAVLMRRGHVVPDPAASGYVYALDTDGGYAAAILNGGTSSNIIVHAVDTILDGHAPGLQVSPLEAVFVAGQWGEVSSGACLLARERFGDDLVAEVLILAAAQSNVAGRPNEALTFSRKADRITPSTAATVELARALASLDLRASALTILGRCPVDGSSYAGQLAWFRGVAAMTPFGLGKPAEALLQRSAGWHLNDPTFAAERLLAGMVPLADEDSPLELLTSIVADERVDVRTRLNACGDLAMFAAYQGELGIVTDTVAAAARLSAETSPDPYQQLQQHDVAVAVLCEMTVGQTLLREHLDRLRSDLDRRMSSSIKRRHYSHVASLGVSVGALAIAHGDYITAERELRAASDRYTGSEPIGWKAWAACEHAAVLTAVGRIEEAEHRLAQVRHQDDPEKTWYAYPYRTVRVALDRARGRFDEARQEALALAAEHAQSPVVRVHQFFAAAALGEPADSVAPEAVRIAHETPLPSLVAMADFLRTKQEGDADGAYAAADRLRLLGLLEAAKEAFDYAAQRSAEIGDKRRQREAANLAAAVDARIRGENPEPARGLDLSVLSARERQIVDLIAAGRSNREISESLFLSVRTVESHVYRVLRKLSVTGRRDLMPGAVAD
jgi:DNA-binding CsgD family transcriptional regulator